MKDAYCGLLSALDSAHERLDAEMKSTYDKQKENIDKVFSSIRGTIVKQQSLLAALAAGSSGADPVCSDNVIGNNSCTVCMNNMFSETPKCRCTLHIQIIHLQPHGVHQDNRMAKVWVQEYRTRGAEGVQKLANAFSTGLCIAIIYLKIPIHVTSMYSN